MICRYCGIEVRGWNGTDDLGEIHSRANGACPLVMAKTLVDSAGRRDTFPGNWGGPSPDRMARAGFAFTGGSSAMCVECMSLFDEWEASDDPFVVHSCTFRSPEPSAPPAEDGDCFVCMSARRSVAAIPCGHVPCCEKCSATVSRECPVCRQKVDRYVKIFF